MNVTSSLQRKLTIWTVRVFGLGALVMLGVGIAIAMGAFE